LRLPRPPPPIGGVITVQDPVGGRLPGRPSPVAGLYSAVRAAVAQLARASACHAEGRGFESLQPLQKPRKCGVFCGWLPGGASVAMQKVEVSNPASGRANAPGLLAFQHFGIRRRDQTAIFLSRFPIRSGNSSRGAARRCGRDDGRGGFVARSCREATSNSPGLEHVLGWFERDAPAARDPGPSVGEDGELEAVLLASVTSDQLVH
jgi:hypothetical protein